MLTDLLIVNSVCRQRGQNPQIALELKRLISENKDVKVIQSECRSCNMSKFFFFFFATLYIDSKSM